MDGEDANSEQLQKENIILVARFLKASLVTGRQ